MVTPFDADGNVDEDAAVALMHHLIEHGSDGLVICGTTGEASTLDDEEHLGMIRLAVEEMRGTPVTIVAGVGSNDTHHAISLTERATEIGPDALLHVNPYYNRPSRRGIVRHYEEVCRATDLPILLYNIPQRTGSDMPNDLLAELGQLDNISESSRPTPTTWPRSTACRSTPATTTCSPTSSTSASRAESSSPATYSAKRCAGWSTSPTNGGRSTTACKTSTPIMPVAPLACATKAALHLLGLLPCAAPRLPYVELDERELDVIRAMLERHLLLHASRA